MKFSTAIQNEVVRLRKKGLAQKEKEEKASEKLVELYRKLEQAKKVTKNIENEIADYEMDLES